MSRRILSFLGRSAITLLAFWVIFQRVDVAPLVSTLRSAHRGWLLLGIIFYFLAQFGCITRWSLLVPSHPMLTWGFLANSYYVGAFFNTFLPTTVGGDVVRGYDLIKATGQWREPVASLFLDRFIGLISLLVLALLAWGLFPPVRHDPVILAGLLGLCLLVLVTLSILGSRRVLQASLKPFGRVGLGQLQSHGKQFQETLFGYLRRPKVLLAALGISMGMQILGIGLFVSVSQTLRLNVPILFLFLIVPIIFTVSMLPVSLNGWGVREGAAILLFGRIGIEPTKALSLSLVCAAISLLAGAIGGILFLLRRRRKKAP